MRVRRHTLRSETLKLFMAFWLLCIGKGIAQQPGGMESYFRTMRQAITMMDHLPPSKPVGYSFMAAGHWYGAHENVRSPYPASTLLNASGLFDNLQPHRVYILGDAMRDVDDPVQVAGFNYACGQLHSIPYMVPGNHDLMADGQFYGHFQACDMLEGDLLICLNTEMLRYGGGKTMLAQLSDTSGSCHTGRNLFVFSHRLLWALAEPGFAEMDDFANEPFAPMVDADTVQLIYNAVLELAGDRPLHWFSGDIGASWSETVFHDVSADGQRHFYAAGLGDCKEDAFWRVVVDSLGHVETSLVPLVPSGQERDPSHYDLAHWRERMLAKRAAEQPSVWEQVSGLIASKKFWLGIVIGLGIATAIGLLIRKKSA